MLKPLEERDTLLSKLIKESFLTSAQVDTLLCEVEGLKKAEKLKERASKRDRKNITLGAYLRTKRQAYSRLNKTLKTIFLLTYLDILPQDKIVLLLKASELLNKVKGKKLSFEESNKILKLLDETITSLLVISQ